MRFTGFKTNAGGLRKLAAFCAALSIVFLSVWVDIQPATAVSAGIQAKIYTGFNTTGVRPMDNPSVVSNYTLCKTTTLTSINHNWGGGNIEGCGSDDILIHYTGYLYSATAQTLYFQGYSDDGFWAKVGSTVVVNNWVLQGCNASSTGSGVSFAAGEYKAVDAWFYEYGGGACSRLYSSTSSGSGFDPVPTSMYTLDNYQPASITDGSVNSQVAVNASYSDQITAAGSGTLTYAVNTGALPPGLSLNASSGAITGTPNTTGTYNFTIRATAVDGGNTTTEDTGNLTITVGSAVSLSSGLTSQTIWVGESFTDNVTFSSYPNAAVTKASGTIPPGLTLSTSGTLSGAATTPGTYVFAVKGTNFVSQATSPNYTIVVENFPDFTNDVALTASVMKGATFSTSATVTGNGVSYSLYSGDLPTGLSLDSATGEISGRPTEAGEFTYRLKALNRSGFAISSNSTITVNSLPVFTDTAFEDALAHGSAYSYHFNASGFPAPTYSVYAGALPNGLTLNSTTGVVSGAPTQGGEYTFTLRASNNFGHVDVVKNVAVTMPPHAVDTTLLLDVSAGNNYVDVVEYDAYPAPTYSIVDGSLPTGLTLNASTGAITGIPTVGGLFNFKVRATSGGVSSTTSNFALAVKKSPSGFNSAASTRANLSLGHSFTFDFLADGYPVPTYSISHGRLPEGMTLASDGTISGTPTEGGVFEVTVKATNVKGDVEVVKTLAVTKAPTATDSTLLLEILVGGRYIDAVQFDSYPEPRYSVVDGSLPAGLTLNETSGAITGNPTTGGLYNFKIKATNGTVDSTTDNFALVVKQAPVIVDDNVVGLSLLGKSYSDAVSCTGYPLPTYSVTKGGLPIGLSLNATTGAITGSTTSTGNFDFTITATNELGTQDFNQSIAVHSPAKILRVNFPEALTMGSVIAGKVTASGFPSPLYKVASGSLPEGIELNPVTGEIAGIVTNGGKYSFTISATNAAGTDTSSNFTGDIVGVETQIALGAQIGDVITGKQIKIAGEGLKPLIDYDVILRSEPQKIGGGKTSAVGDLNLQTKIPGGLEAGWHSITINSTNADGTPYEKAVYFQVTDTLMLEEISEDKPTAQELKDALTNDDEFYAKMGIDPAGTVTPEAAAQQVETVTSVVASVAMVSAAAASVAAAAGAAGAAASAAGGAASSAGGAASGGSSSGGGARTGGSSSSSSGGGSGTRSAGGSSSGGSSGGSSSGGSSGGSSGSSDSGDSDSADFENLEADHDDFEAEGFGLVDRLKVWRWKPMTAIDNITVDWVEKTSRFSPVVSRIINDGSYLQALLGSLVVIGYFTSVVLGVAAVDPSAQSMAASGRTAFVLGIMALGMFDALAGALGMVAFVVASIAMFGIVGVGDVRYLMAMMILGFAPSIMATTFRKIRRPAIENIKDAWERVMDLALIGFVSVLTVMTLVTSVSAFAGATVPLAADVKSIAFTITVVALARVVLEEAAAKFAPERLNRINPTEVPGPANWQPWASLGLKFGTLILMIGGMVGMGWHLWVGAVLIFLPGIIGMIWTELPKVRLIHEFIPGGIGALAFATLISGFSGDAVNALLGKSELYGALSFILIPLPVILISIVGLFAKNDEKLWQRTGKHWIYVLGGIAVFAFTVQVTNFIPTIFG